jgi:putative NADH-flavin reductase
VVAQALERGHLVTAIALARISRADVADAMLRCLDDTTTHRKRFVIAP